jgi:hypothetical protein
MRAAAGLGLPGPDHDASRGGRRGEVNHRREPFILGPR